MLVTLLRRGSISGVSGYSPPSVTRWILVGFGTNVQILQCLQFHAATVTFQSDINQYCSRVGIHV